MAKKENAVELYKNYYKDSEYGSERYEWIAETFFLDIKGKAILEVGCGTGSLLKILQQNNNVYGVDISESGIQKAKKENIKCELININRDSLPFPDNSFDICICLETIEHLENPYHCLKEIRRVLKKKGRFLISIPNPKTMHPYFYPSIFTINNLKELLSLTSFSVIRIAGWGQVILFRKLLDLLKKKEDFLNKKIYNVIYYIGRKINMIMRKYFRTPLSYAHCFNFECINMKDDNCPAIEEMLSKETRP